jgi:ribonuclease HII
MRFLLGVDEAGRGPLAGPVSVGVVMVPEGFDVAKEFPGVADSKKLTEKKREQIFKMLEARIVQGDVQFCVEFESAEAIDKEGIVPAIRSALARGVEKLVPRSSTSESSLKSNFNILLDGALRAPDVYKQETSIGGDASVPLISLASIAAKVLRDRLMTTLATEYPQYAFEKHKGYGTALHYALLREHGLSPLHRRSFLKNL